MILIAELDKELVIVRCSCMDLSDIKDQWLFALWNVKYHSADSFAAPQRNWNILRWWRGMACATIAISATSDHVTVSHNISAMIFSSYSGLYCYCYRYFLTLCGTKWKALSVALKSRLRGPKEYGWHHKKYAKVCECVCVCVCSVALLCSVLWWHCYFTYCIVICCLAGTDVRCHFMKNARLQPSVQNHCRLRWNMFQIKSRIYIVHCFAMCTHIQTHTRSRCNRIASCNFIQFKSSLEMS